ncbi:hypothetical protein NL337_26480, partial [Klebsiella pneumoniae]|nr:hypothetical protein [Klebsiella pneumoniae]
MSQLAALLEDLPGEAAAATHRQLALVNELLVWLRQRLTPGTAPGAGSGPVDLLSPPARVLRAVRR